MKANILLILLSALFILPVDAQQQKKRRRRPNYKNIGLCSKTVARTFLIFDINVKEENNTLILTFQNELQNACISITDKNGDTVIYEPETFCYEGKIMYIYAPKAYPYTVEITSPTLDMTGEITFEEDF